MKKPNLFFRLLLPRIDDILFVGILVCALALGPRMLNIDGDLGRHLTIGRYILMQGQIPTSDIFSHTMAGKPLTPHEWLAEVLFAVVYQWMDFDGIVLFCAVIIATAFTLLFRTCMRRSRSPFLCLGLCLFGAAASSVHWLPRPHLFTILILVIWLGGLDDVYRGKKLPLVWMPILMLIWANLHGAFIAGFVTWLIFGFGAIWERFSPQIGKSTQPNRNLASYGLLGGLCLGASLINPAGIHLWGTSLGYLQNDYLVTHTQEYFSPDFHQVNLWPFLLLVLLSVFLWGMGKAKNSPMDVFMLTAWTGMSLISQRNIPLYCLVAVPILAQNTEAWINQLKGSAGYLRFENRLYDGLPSLVGWFWPGFLVVGLGALFVSHPNGTLITRQNAFSSEAFPVEAVSWLEENPQKGEVFNYFPWGGYLLFRLWPEQRVFIDGQTDFYGEALTREYETVITLGKDWQNIFNKYDVEWVIMPSESRLVSALVDDPAWRTVYRDDTAAILARERSQ